MWITEMGIQALTLCSKHSYSQSQFTSPKLWAFETTELSGPFVTVGTTLPIFGTLQLRIQMSRVALHGYYLSPDWEEK